MGGRKKKIPDTFTLDKTGTLCDVEFVILALIATGKTRPALTDDFRFGEEWISDNIRAIFSKLKAHCIETAIDRAWELHIFTHDNRFINPVWKTMSFLAHDKNKDKPANN